MRRGLLAGLAVLALGASAYSQATPKNPNTSKAYWRCMGAVNINSGKQDAVDAAFLACARRELSEQDSKLGQAVKSALGELKDADKKRLRDIQDVWRQLRDINCSMLAERSMAGAGRDAERTRCMMEWTANRAEELQAAYYVG